MPAYSFTYRQLAAFKAQWPCHGISDEITFMSFTFDTGGDLVDIEATGDNGQHFDAAAYDGPAALALSQDAYTLATGEHVTYLPD
jgi:hypothetical protein